MTEDNPIFASPLSTEEFEYELAKFNDEDENKNESEWTLSARWADLIAESDEANSQINMQIMAHACGDNSLHGSLVRMLQLGLEIGYRLGTK